MTAQAHLCFQQLFLGAWDHSSANPAEFPSCLVQDPREFVLVVSPNVNTQRDSSNAQVHDNVVPIPRLNNYRTWGFPFTAGARLP